MSEFGTPQFPGEPGYSAVALVAAAGGGARLARKLWVKALDGNASNAEALEELSRAITRDERSGVALHRSQIGESFTSYHELPKPYFPLTPGTTVLEWTVGKLWRSGCFDRIVIATREPDMPYARAALSRSLPGLDEGRLSFVCGGKTRQESVLRALNALPQRYDVVCIHDAARPFFSVELLRKVLYAGNQHGAALAALREKNSLKLGGTDGRVIRTVPREGIWEAQTPQAFQWELFKSAHDRACQEGTASTDDAELVELLGRPVLLVEGEDRNFKITTESDYELARVLAALEPD